MDCTEWCVTLCTVRYTVEGLQHEVGYIDHISAIRMRLFPIIEEKYDADF